MTTRLLQLVYAPDGAALAGEITASLAGEQGLEIQRNPLGGSPPPEQLCVLAFLLTPDAFTDREVLQLGKLASTMLISVLPVVPVLSEYRFDELPHELAYLKTLNAVGWDQGTVPGEDVVESIRKLLGFVPFKRDRQVFISYKRSDGAAVAQAAYAHLSDAGFWVFLDTEALEGGDPVQSRIHAAIPERDFLVLVNSPDAYASGWVKEEVEVALNRSVTVLVLDLPGSRRMPLLRNLPGLPWVEADPGMPTRVEIQVAARLATRWGFDQRVRQCLQTVCNQQGLSQQVRDRRRLLLEIGSDPLCLIDYEDAPHGLDRLYRLYQGHAAEAASPTTSLLVHNGLPLSVLEQEAVEWAAKPSPLKVIAVEELIQTLDGLVI